MNFEQLEYAVEVAKTRSITLASAKLMVTPSTISQALTRLEEELNVKLFHRTRKGVHPLEDAAHLFDKFRTVLETLQSIKESTETFGKGELILSVIPGGVPSIIQTISKMKQNHSEIKFELSEKTTIKIIKEVQEQSADLGLIAIYEEDVRTQLKGLIFHPISSGKLYAAVSKSNPLAKKKSVTLGDFKNEMFVLFNDEFVDPFIKEVEKTCGPVNVLFRTNNSEVIGSALLQLNAVTVGHEYSFDNSPDHRHNDYFKIGIDMPQRDILIGWIVDKRNAGNPIVNRFMERHRFDSNLNRQSRR
jgi:DNA-binding transcriptional LysR family regulator